MRSRRSAGSSGPNSRDAKDSRADEDAASSITPAISACFSASVRMPESSSTSVIGHSFGGSVALHLAVTRPELVRGTGRSSPSDSITTAASIERSRATGPRSGPRSHG
jgi:pimeloyl-ACP methyl ester carboxylesterase